MDADRRQPNTTALAKNLRKNMTAAERALWRHLRARRFVDQKFNRQVPIGRYIVDFCSFENRLIIEVDGGQHDESREKDDERTRYLGSQNFKVIRFWNNEVLTNIEGVMFEIEKALKSQTSSK